MAKTIDDLKQRLANKRELVEPLEDAAWTYGISTTYLKDVLEYWRTKYNWSERQALLNKYPQYVTNIQGNKSTFLPKPAIMFLRVFSEIRTSVELESGGIAFVNSFLLFFRDFILSLIALCVLLTNGESRPSSSYICLRPNRKDTVRIFCRLTKTS